MATYYVRKSGNNGNAGTSAGAAFLTIAHAASVVAAGDTVWIGAGTYREAVALSTAGSAGNYITWNGDVDGVHTGDSGDVIWTNFTTDDKTAASSSVTLNLAAKSYQKFNTIQFVGGSSTAQFFAAVIEGRNSGQQDHIQFTNCTFVTNTLNSSLVVLDLAASASATGILFDTCAFVGTYDCICLYFLVRFNGSADNNTGVIVRNCLALTLGRGICYYVDAGGSGSFRGGGVTFSQCVALGGEPVVNLPSPLSSQYPVVFLGCYLFGGQNGIVMSNMDALEDWNLIDVTTARSGGLVAGPNSVAGHAYAPMWETWGAFVTGRAARPFLQPMAGSGLLGFLPQGTQIAVGVPTSTVDDATVGTISWTNPNNAQRLDSTVATCVLTASAVGHYLLVTGLGFALPSTATVTTVRVEYFVDYTGTGVGAPNSVKLIKGGVIGGTDESASMAALINGSLTYQAVGGAADLWGNTLLYSDVNASNFGVAISFKNTSGASTATINLDYIRVYVEYTDSATPVEQTTDFAGGARPAGGQTSIAVGAFDRGNTGVNDTSTYDVAPSSVRIDGPGYQDFPVAVDAVATTLTAKLRWNSSYAGTLPQLRVLNGTECGVANQTVTASGSANAWNATAITFTPTAKGIVTIRFLSNTTAAAGSAWIDTAS